VWVAVTAAAALPGKGLVLGRGAWEGATEDLVRGRLCRIHLAGGPDSML